MKPSQVKQIVESVEKRLEAFGFGRRSQRIFTSDAGEDVLGWIGLNLGQGGSTVRVNPVVAVRHQAVERTVADACDRAFHPYIPPTLGTYVGNLMPTQPDPFIFSEGVSIDSGVERIASAIEQVGIPFIRSNADLGDLCETMEASGLGIPEIVDYRLPAGYALLGQLERARLVLDRATTGLGDRQDPAALDYRRFAERLAPHLKGHSAQTVPEAR